MTSNINSSSATTAAAKIDALSIAAEFLMCAIRELAMGEEPEGERVRQPVEWAVSKIGEADLLTD